MRKPGRGAGTHQRPAQLCSADWRGQPPMRSNSCPELQKHDRGTTCCGSCRRLTRQERNHIGVSALRRYLEQLLQVRPPYPLCSVQPFPVARAARCRSWQVIQPASCAGYTHTCSHRPAGGCAPLHMTLRLPLRACLPACLRTAPLPGLHPRHRAPAGAGAPRHPAAAGGHPAGPGEHGHGPAQGAAYQRGREVAVRPGRAGQGLSRPSTHGWHGAMP